MFIEFLIIADVIILIILLMKPSVFLIISFLIFNAICLAVGIFQGTSEYEIVSKYYYLPTKFGNIVIVESETRKDSYCFKPSDLIYQQTDLKTADITLELKTNLYGMKGVGSKLLIKKKEKKEEPKVEVVS